MAQVAGVAAQVTIGVGKGVDRSPLLVPVGAKRKPSRRPWQQNQRNGNRRMNSPIGEGLNLAKIRLACSAGMSVIFRCLSRVAAGTITRDDAVIEHRVFDPSKSAGGHAEAGGKRSGRDGNQYFSADSRAGVGCERSAASLAKRRFNPTSADIADGRRWLRVRVVTEKTQCLENLSNVESGHRAIAEYFARCRARTARNGREFDRSNRDQSGTGKRRRTSSWRKWRQISVGNRARPKIHGRGRCAFAIKRRRFYDKITSHGTNAVKEEKAIRQAIDRRPQQTER